MLRLSLTGLFAWFLLGACGGTSTPLLGGDAGVGDDAQSSADAAGAADTSTTPDSSIVDPADGTPSYTSACTPLTKQTGTAINTAHGRLDGTLAYVVPQNGPFACNGDSSHIHLQVLSGGAIYDIAVDIGKFAGDTLSYEADMPLPDGPWAEGWHGTDGLGYPKLGVHSGQFVSDDPATFGKKLEAELAGVNHISVFGMGYTQQNGAHLIHYVNGYNDGAIVLHPLAANAHVIFVRFSTATF